MAENIAFKITGDAGPITESVKGLKAQLREATEDVVRLSSQFGSTSQQAIAAARSAANLREQIADSRDLIAAFHPEQKFAAFGAAIQGVTGGFSALTGAMGLFGVDSENLQKTLVKVQSAMALSEGINSILSAKDAFMNLGAVVKGPIVSAFNFLKTAMMTNPIMLLVTVLAGVVLSFKKTRDAIMNFIPGLKQLVGWISDAIDTVKGWIGASDEAAEAQEKLKEATDELNESMDKQITAIDKATERLKLHAEYAGKAQSEIEKIDQQGQAKKKEYYDNLLQQAKTFGVYNEGVQKLYDERVAALQDENMKKEISRRSSHETKKTTIHDDGLKKREAAAKEAEEKEKARLENEMKWKEEFVRLEFLRLGVEGDKIRAENAKRIEDDERMRKESEAAMAADQAASDAFMKPLIAQSEAEIELRQRTEAAKLDIINAGLGAVSDLVGRETVIGKGIAVAQSIINTYQGATKALATYAPPFGAVAAGTVIAAGIANVRKIIATKIPGATGGGGSVPSAGSIPAPLAPQAQVTNTRIDQGQVNAMGNATVRAFVTESDVTGVQDRIRRLNRAARI